MAWGRTVIDLIEPFLILFIAHLIGDFVLQTEQMALKKGYQLPWLAYHATQVGLITCLLCWSWNALPVVAVVFLTHLVFDAIKPHLPGSPLKWYIWDQIGHIVTLLFCAHWMVAYFRIQSMPLTAYIPLDMQVIIAAYLFVARPLTVSVGLFLRPWQEDMLKVNGDDSDASELTGLNRSGEWIGNLERFFALTCVLAEQYMPIAGLLIAKAIMRFGEISQPKQRKKGDYVILGTFASVGLATAVGLIACWLMRMLALQ